MPLSSSFASLSKNGFQSYATTDSTNTHWMSAIDLRMNSSTASTSYEPSVINTLVHGGGRGANTTFRPYAATLDPANGLINWYKVFADTTSIAGFSVRVDSSGNSHLFSITSTGNVQIYEYDSSGIYVKGVTVSTVYNTITYFIDSSDNLYIVSYSGALIYITQIDSSTYTILWSRTITINALRSVNTFDVEMDSADNIIIGYSNTVTYLGLVKYNPTSNSIVWSVGDSVNLSLSNKNLVIDSSDNIYVGTEVTSPSTVSKVVKVDGSTGAKLFEYNCSGINLRNIAIDTSTNNIYYNYLDGASYYTSLFTSGASLSVVRTIVQPRNTTSYSGLVVLTDANNAYLNGSIKNVTSGRTVATVLKIPKDLNYTTSSAYSFSLTSDNGTSYSYSGTIYITSTTNPTLTSAINITLATVSGVTIGTFAPTTASSSPTTNTTVPFNYTLPLA